MPELCLSIEAKLDCMQADVSEMKVLVGSCEDQVTGMSEHLSNLGRGFDRMNATVGRMEGRVSRIERRLDLIEA